MSDLLEKAYNGTSGMTVDEIAEMSMSQPRKIRVTHVEGSDWLYGDDDRFWCQHDGDSILSNEEFDTVNFMGEHDTYWASVLVCEDCGEELKYESEEGED